ncbi:CBO0543 family protein [Sporomusa malonica]|uniref:Uncharacterized protein n=1 Tax=Sporomusa malonica TaxID=112901 RepID=A0A1W2EVP4_9FIRM|nr:CBO0543 family protein [Sporomusa malonica]SMD13767.1 hypothetical protein SAMN04488500_13214 [Sporomusa malonica]
MTFSMERIIIGVAWVITALALWLWIPRDRYSLRKAQVAFFFMQMVTWIFGLLVVEWGLIEYPIHEFEHANMTSFTFEFFVYPVICTFYNLYYPETQRYFYEFWYTVLYCTPITLLEIILEKYTELIGYIHWAWYWTWITLFLTFRISRAYIKWFYSSHDTS